MAHWLLALSQVRVSVHGQDRLPPHQPLVVVSNHRSIMDAPLLMSALGRPVRFACHHYMGQVPGLRNLVNALGCLPRQRTNRILSPGDAGAAGGGSGGYFS
jgi:1-acyl-sn-glycerol-3-phosphate acyltransferase